MYEKNLPGNIGIRKEFIDVVTKFKNWTKTQFDLMDGEKIRCPCSNCRNNKFKSTDDVTYDLNRKGFVKITTIGHLMGNSYNESHTNEAGLNSNDGVQHNTDNLGALSEKKFDVVRASDQPLYSGSETHSQLSAVARYKPTRGQNSRRKKSAYATLRYLSITPRLQRLYASNTIAEHMSWHATHETESGVVCHPSDAKAWKYFNETYPDFALEPRNVHLGLCADGFASWTI
ncbi:UNVERIFIED_CONTAM: hypothetical protein Slati_2887800 [Sesamum latifolium]|uniref:Transposase-associated domain-containing protein n=1 Tax=Sesamum latifolium TaxID=2727402 RepID=A0AAW2VDX4_9LAMI